MNNDNNSNNEDQSPQVGGGVAETERAVVDRFEGDLAILYVGESDEPLDVPRHQLPPGVKAGHHLNVVLQDGQVVSAEIDDAATVETRNRIRGKLDRLRRGEHLQD